MIESVLDNIRLLADVLLLLAFADRRSFLEQSLLLLCLGFRLVFVEELEGLGGGVAVEHVGELRDRGGDFETEVEDRLLALQTDVFGPLYHAREVAAWLDILANAEVARTFFNERVLRVRGRRSVS